MVSKTINPTIINILKLYKERLLNTSIKLDKMILFGSFAKGDYKKYSDIDVAIVGSNFPGDGIDNYVYLSRLADGIDLRIEPHEFTLEDFNDKWNPLASEVKKHGILID